MNAYGKEYSFPRQCAFCLRRLATPANPANQPKPAPNLALRGFFFLDIGAVWLGSRRLLRNQGCERRGIEPRKHFSGKFSLRVDPATHEAAAIAAAAHGQSLNQWAAEAIRQAALQTR